MRLQSDLREIAANVAAQYLFEDDDFDQRQADAPPAVLPKVQEDLEKELAQAGKMLSQTLRNMVRRHLSPKALPFFLLYVTLKRISLGESPPEDLSDQYVKSVRLLTRIKSPYDGRKISPPIINDLIDRMPKMRGWLKRIERGGLIGDPTWRRIVENYSQDIVRISRDKGVFMKGRRVGPQRWQVFRKMRPKEETTERLKDEDPQAYEAVMLSRLTRGQIESRIESDIEAEGFVSETLTVMRHRVKVGVDPIWMDELRQHEAQKPTKPRRLKKGEEPTDRWSAQKAAWDTWTTRMAELRQNSTTVYTLGGDVMSVDQYKEWVLQDRERRSKAKKKLLPEEQIAALRKVDDATLGSLDTPKSYVALTDDAVKHQATTKVYAVQEMTDPETYLERKVVVSGRYKGCFVDDLVNEQGRLIEGTGYIYQPGTRRGSRVKKRIDPSDLEPYATTSEEHPGHMFLSLPGKIGPRGGGKHVDTVVKEIMEKLSKRVGPPGIILAGKTKTKSYRGKTQYKASYYVSPENFALVRQEIGGMSLSRSSMKMLDSYFADLARAEQATEKENLKFYEAEQLGGFRKAVKKPGKPARTLKLLTKQKQALAWLEANEDKGVVALDTGVGKCAKYNTFCATDRGLLQLHELNPGLTTPDTTAPVEGVSVVVGGRMLPLKNFYYGGEKPTIRATTRYEFELEGSLIHPLLVRIPGGSLEWVKTPDLVVGDYLCVDRSEGCFPTEEPELYWPHPDEVFRHNLGNVYEVPDRMNPELSRFLGYLIGEGWTNGSDKFSLSQDGDINPEVRADIESLLRSQFGWSSGAYQGEDIQVSSKYLCAFLGSDELKVMGRLSKDKVVPPAVLRSTRESMRQFLRGYIDAECSISPTQGIELSSASKELSRTIQIMLLRFGVVARRRPKKVKGYDHTYWVTHIFGESARLFMQNIGLVSQRKIEALVPVLERPGNTNHDIVPHVAHLVQQMHAAILSIWGGNVASFRDRFGSSVHNTMNHIRLGRRNASYRFLRELLDVFDSLTMVKSNAYREIQNIIDRNYFYDPIVDLQEGSAVVMDIEVDDPSHCFVGNGLMNHNTLTSIASMQKMLRDGWAEPGSGTNGRFLYVAPKNLVGNIKDQVYDFLTREAAADLIGRLDVLSYAQFRNARKRGKVTVKRKMGTKVETFTYDPWEPGKYIIIYFDEAQELSNYRNKTSQAALSLNHPRKICLTASPMENEPMDAYVLTSVCNNIDISQKGEEGRRLRRNMRLFKERFCEEVGGRIVGLKKTRPGATEEEELAKRDLHTWSKRNIFYADKEDVEEFALPELEQETRTVVMPKTVEKEYRKASKKIVGQLRALVEKYEKGGYVREVVTEGPATEQGARPTTVLRLSDPSTGDIKSIRKIPAAHDPKIEQWASKNMKPVIRLLWELALYPEAHVDLKKNPKIEESTRIVRDKLVDGGRSLLFTDDPKMVLKTAKGLSEKIPGKVHVAMLGSKGHFFRDGSEIKQYTVRGEVKGQSVDHAHKLPWTPRPYRLFLELDADPVENRHYNKADWASFVLNQIVQPDSDVATCTLHGKSYSTGQNLQAFGTVIHLDRDTWNNEEMKQRTARSWRQGQDMPVHEIILDMKYDQPKDDLDRTMDEIRALFQVLSGKLFDKIVKEAQTTELGKEWTEEMEKRMASFLKLDQDTFEMAMSPWLGGLPIMM